MVDSIELIKERGQMRPADWPTQNPDIQFGDHKWRSLNWVPLVHKSKLSESTSGSSCAVKYGDTQLAIFYVVGRGYYCTQTMCPHKRAFVLHDGILADDGFKRVFVTFPLHKREFDLVDGKSSDPTMSIAIFDVKEGFDGMLLVELPAMTELDMLLGISRWKIRA